MLKVLLSILLVGGPFFLYSQSEPKNIKGSGYVLTQQRETAYFNSIEVSQNISVYIVQGALQPITVEADNNLFDYIKTVVRNRVLKIYISDTVNIVKFADMNVLISMPTLSYLSANRNSYIDGSPQNWKVSTIYLDARTGSHIKLHTTATNIKVSAHTSATLELKGETSFLEADLNTASRLYAKKLDTQDAQLILATDARAEVNVHHTISYDLSGNAQLIIHGKPLVKKAQLNSRGKVVYKE